MPTIRENQIKSVTKFRSKLIFLKIVDYSDLFNIHRHTAKKQYLADLEAIKSKYRYMGKKINIYYFRLLYGINV